jgi:hypothetical protein
MKGAKKAEVKYITAHERKEHTAAAGSSSSGVIFDMRGPNARILQTEQVCRRGIPRLTFARLSQPVLGCLYVLQMLVSHAAQVRSEVAPLNDGPFPELEHNM